MPSEKTIGVSSTGQIAQQDETHNSAVFKLAMNVISIFKESPFTVVRPQREGPSTLFASGKYANDTWNIKIVVFMFLGVDDVRGTLRLHEERHDSEKFNEVWVLGQHLSEEVLHLREVIRRGVRILSIEELPKVLKEYEPVPITPERLPRVRGRIAQTILANGDQLRTAVATSILLTEEKLSAVESEKPNSHRAKKQRAESISELTKIRGQLQEIGQLSEKLKKGEIKEKEAAQKITTFADGVKAMWAKKHDVICLRAFDLGLFSSYVLVGSLAGAPGALTLAVSAAMVGGKPVMDSLKSLGKKLFQ